MSCRKFFRSSSFHSWQRAFRTVARQFCVTSIAILVLLVLASCNQVSSESETPGPANEPIANTVLAPTSAPPPTVEPSPIVIPTQPLPAPTESVPTADGPAELAIAAEDIQLFPVPKIISGDRVTFQVQPSVPVGITPEFISVEIFVDDQLISAGNLGSRNLAGTAQGIYEWVWNTSGRPGYHQVRVVLDSQDLIQEGDEDQENNETTFAVRVGKSDERPLEERGAKWVDTEIDCCNVHAITRTAAYRDLPELLSMIESAVSESSSNLNELPERKIDVYFVDRTIGQGGYSGTEMVVVYNDRSYVGGELYELLKHEAVHVIDRQFAPQRIALLAEGVAVWASGGHYWPQDLQQRAAALLRLNRYIPLAELANNMYPAQHEISYLEAGAFVDYLVDRFGWEAVREFYSDTSASDGVLEADALDQNLRLHFDSSLAEMEAAWLAELGKQSPSDEELENLRATIRYFDTAREYQLQHDPTAYFRSAWLPSPEDVVRRGNPADFLRQPDKEINFALELMLRAAYEAIGEQDFGRADVLLDSIERFLAQEGITTDPLLSTYQEIVHTAVAFGYEPQQVTLDGNTASILATTASGNKLFNLDLELQRGDWILLSN